MTVHVFKAGNGDSILINFQSTDGAKRNILVDGGNDITDYKKYLRAFIIDLKSKNEILDLLIITHIDQDHIKGIIYLLEEIQKKGSELENFAIAEIWFNSTLTKTVVSTASSSSDISASDLRRIEQLLITQNSLWTKSLQSGEVIDFYGAKITILSPDLTTLNKYIDAYRPGDIAATADHGQSLKSLVQIENLPNGKRDARPDRALENASSIAFLLEYEDKSILMLGDVIPEVLEASIDRIKKARGIANLNVGIVKLSHHGSRRSINDNFLNSIRSRRFIISTNGKKARLPNKATIAKVLAHKDRLQNIVFLFNYDEVLYKMLFSDKDFQDYNFSSFGPNNSYGCLIEY